MDKLPHLFLKSNLDDVRDKLIEVENHLVGQMSGLRMMVEKGLKVGADPVEEQPPGLIGHLGDIIEIQVVDKPITVTIGEVTSCKLPVGRWMIPHICLTYSSIRVEEKCKIQHFYLDHDERDVLLRGCVNGAWFQTLGDQSVVYKSGVAGKGEPDTIQVDDWFQYRKTLRGTGVYKITVQGFDHAEVQAIYDQIEDCPAVIKCTEPSVVSWLVYGRLDPMFFTITSEDKDAVFDWFREECEGFRWGADATELTEDITTAEEIQEQYQVALAERLEGLRKLVNLGILEPFE